MNLAFRLYLRCISKVSDWKRGQVLPIPLYLDRPVLWFHGASIGELESLWLEIKKELSEKQTLVITIFSPSGMDRLPGLLQELGPFEGKVHFLGLLPSGHALIQTFKQMKVEAFFTTHYDLWPELLYVLSKSDTPLNIVDATFRRSLRLAFFFAKLFKFKMPHLHFQATNLSKAKCLTDAFKHLQASVSVIPHPRRAWIQAKSKRYASVTHPYHLGVLGNLWPSDWLHFGELWLEWLGQNASNRLMIVPHELKQVPWFLNTIPRHLIDIQIESHPIKAPITILNVYGKLLEAYTLANWSYVGGGKERGTHSVLEPLALGIPTSAVSYRLSLFDPNLVLISKKRDMKNYLAAQSVP